MRGSKQHFRYGQLPRGWLPELTEKFQNPEKKQKQKTKNNTNYSKDIKVIF